MKSFKPYFSNRFVERDGNRKQNWEKLEVARFSFFKSVKNVAEKE